MSETDLMILTLVMFGIGAAAGTALINWLAWRGWLPGLR
jgi:hypothetical protein